MEHELGPVRSDVRTTRAIEVAERATSDHEPRAFGERTRCTTACSIGDIVERATVAVGGEEEEVGAGGRANHRRGFDERAVIVVAVEELNGGGTGGECKTVCSHFAGHDGRGDERRDAVVAIAAVTDVVAVDLPDEVERAVIVDKRVGVDGATGAKKVSKEINDE